MAEVGFPTHIPNSAQASEPPLPTVVHLSIRPCPPPGGKDTPKKKGIRRGTLEEGEETVAPGCCSGCVIC